MIQKSLSWNIGSVFLFTLTTDLAIRHHGIPQSLLLFSRTGISHHHVSYTRCFICLPWRWSCFSCPQHCPGRLTALPTGGFQLCFGLQMQFNICGQGVSRRGWICNTLSHIGTISQCLWTPLPTQDTVVRPALWIETQGIYTLRNHFFVTHLIVVFILVKSSQCPSWLCGFIVIQVLILFVDFSSSGLFSGWICGYPHKILKQVRGN